MHLNATPRLRHDVSEKPGTIPGNDGVLEEAQAVIADSLDLKFCGLAPAEVDVMATETVEKLLSLLEPTLRAVVRMRLDTATIAEIAVKLDVSDRTIYRWLDRIREIWNKSGLLDDTPFGRRDTP